MSENPDRIVLSPPHLGDLEPAYVENAFETNWIAPGGPHVDRFEQEFADLIGSEGALAVSSGTAALHLALIAAGVGAGDEVFVSTLTFAASVFPVCYLRAEPTFIDSERDSWNMDPRLLAEALEKRARSGNVPKAVILVHLFGQSAEIEPIVDICERFEVTLVEDAAEALGSTYHGRAPGTFGQAGVFSFNGNKIITTSGGGMLVSDDADFLAQARKLANQAKEPAPHYQHAEIGYNYRLSNVLAAIGRGQLSVLESRVRSRRQNFEFYRDALADLPGITFMPEASWGRHTRWLTVLTVDANQFGATRDDIRLALEEENIEARPVWKPMHLQPVFDGCETFAGEVAEDLFHRGLCLPSGSSLGPSDLERISGIVKRLHEDS